MRLITHNVLACHVKTCTTNNFPLALKDVQLEVRESEFNPVFLRGFWHKLEWDALVQTARAVGDTTLPEQAPSDDDELSDELLQALHHVLMEIHIEEGAMVCPNCAHSYPISNGIPNMLLAEHEIL